jgi:hypothetical protein
MYTRNLANLGKVNTSKDSLSTELKLKLNEIDSLRNEIAVILNNAGITKEDLRRAEQKITELQQKMLSAGKSDVTYSNQQQLPAMVVTNAKSQSAAPVNGKENPPTAFGQNLQPVFIASEISIKALQDQNTTTTKAAQADYLQVSCMLRNTKASFNNADLYLVITDPNGKIIQDDEWEGGVFASATEGRIPYTRKNNFAYNKGETKRITVNVKLSGLNPGAYGVQLYHNGSKIGKADLKLN